MQGKAIAALLSLLSLLILVALAGCGGEGGGESSNRSPTATAPQASARPSAQDSTTTTTKAQLPAEVTERLAKARQSALAERKAQAKAAQPPHIVHHDSGGGSSQFKTKGGDNSIVEYGEEADADEREEAATSLHAFLDSVAAHRWQAACSYMSLGLIGGLELLPHVAHKTDDKGCAEILAALSGPTPQRTLEAAAQADVLSLRVEGDRAFIIYRGAESRVLVMSMVEEEGVWRVGSVGGTPVLE